MKLELQKTNSWLEIDSNAVRHNFKLFKSLAKPSCKLAAVVKANAFGHGLVEFSKLAEKVGYDFLIVDSLEKGIELRKNGITKPILSFGFAIPEKLTLAARNDISITVYDLQNLIELTGHPESRKIKFHIKVDTAFNKQGVNIKDLPTILNIIIANKLNLNFEGLYTHFVSAKDPNKKEKTLEQIKIFSKWVNGFKKAGLNFIAHAAATSGAILYPESHFDMVRIGIGSYGLWPSKELKNFSEKKILLRPVFSWKALIKDIMIIGVKKVAVCEVNFLSDFDESVLKVPFVLLKGAKARVIMRSKKELLIDVSNIANVLEGDEVVLLGKSENKNISIHDWEYSEDLICYDFLAKIDSNLPRIYM